MTICDKVMHVTNPLHVYCRLRDVKIPKQYAVKISRLYEKRIFKPIYDKYKILVNKDEKNRYT